MLKHQNRHPFPGGCRIGYANLDYPKDPEFRKKFGPRGVLCTWANGVGTQRIEDTGQLTEKRMETCDEDGLVTVSVDERRAVGHWDAPIYGWGTLMKGSGWANRRRSASET